MKGLLHSLVGLLCLLVSSNLLAQPIFTIESEDAAAGTEVCLDITGDDFDNIFGFQFTINYDASVLEFTSSTSVTLGGSPVNLNNSAPGDVRVQWSLFAIEGLTNFDPFLIGTICFNVLSDQETTVVFSSSVIAAEVTGQSGQITGVVYNDGVVNQGNVGAPSDVVFDFGNGQIIPGQTVCQSVTVSDFTDISSFQFTINNPLGAVATPSLQNPHPSLTGTLGITGNNTAIISYDHGGGSVSLADGLVAFEICHDIPANYTDPSPKIITEGAAGTAMTGGGEMAAIDVLPGTASPPAGGSDDFIFDLSDGSGAVGTTVCLDVTVNAFEAVGSFQFSLNYDVGVLQWESFSNLAFPDMQASQPSNSPGQIRVSWVYGNPDNAGGTLNDGDVLMTVCFVILADSETDVVFSNTPIGIEAFDNNLNPFNIITDDGTINAGSVGGPSCNDGVQNGDETGVDCGGSCAPCSAGGDELTFSLSDGNGSVGQQVCLDLITSNHTDIAAWQFSINFDTDFLAYTNFTSNPAYGAMNSEIQVFNSAPGVLRVIWSDNTTDFDGFSFPDGTVLATFCFTIVDAGPTTVDITNDPIVIIAANAMGQTLPVTTNDGSVNGGVTATCDDGIQNGNETGVDCGGDCTPCVSCDNGIQDGGETGVDCGGPDCAPCNPGNGDELLFDLQDGSGGVGSQVCLDITTANFTQITAFQFSVNFDGAFLDFASSSYNSAFDDAGSPVLINEDSNGDIRIIWVDNLLNGVTLPDGATVITLCFNVLNDGQTNVALSGTPIPVIGSNVSGNSVDIIVNGGVVNGSGQQPTCSDGIQNGNETGVDCGGPDCAPCMVMGDCSDGQQNGQETGVDCGGPDCSPCTTDLVFDLVNATCDGDGNACVDLITTGFTSITGFQFMVNFDETAMTYVDFTPNPIFASSGSPVTTFSSVPGVIQALFVDGTTEFDGITLDDLTVVGTFCFSNVADGNTDLSISGIVATDDSGMAIPAQGFGATVSCGGDVPTCSDGIQNGNETGVDCGGPDCAPCPPSCSDGIQNGDEEGIDCGGSSCSPCMTMADCNDGQQNGQETGVDCGGPDCNPCTTDLVFDLVNATCDGDGNACVDLITTGFSSITGFQFAVNYDETAMTYDNFTANPVFAAMGSPVTVFSSTPGTIQALFVDGTTEFDGITLDDFTVIGTFCFSSVADGNTDLSISGIVATDDSGSAIPAQGFGATVSCGGDVPTCNDGIQNGNETGVDCGGPDCAPCPPTCDDGIQNGDEEGIDCGGSSCMPCMSEPTCDDGMQNGQETGVDCGGPDCTPCTTDLVFDLVDAICDGDGNACVTMITTGFVSITGFQFAVNYDETAMTYDNFTANPVFAAMGSPVTAFSSTPGTIQALFVDGTAEFNGITLNPLDTIGTFCFSNVADGTTDLTITGIVATDDTGSPIPAQGFGATVSCGDVTEPTCNDGIQNGNETGVDCGGPDCDPCDTCDNGVQDGNETGVDCGGDCNACETDITFTLTNGTGAVGTQVCLDVVTFDFNEVTGFQFSLAYDPSLLQFMSATGVSQLPGLMATSGSPGQISVDWDGSSPVTIGNGGEVLEVCFMVLGPDVCTADVTFSNTPTPIGADNVNNDIVTVFTNNGVINSGNPCGDPPPNLVLDIGDANGGEGSEICLDVTVENFIDLTDLQFSATFDPSILTFDGGGNFNLAGLSNANFGNPTPGVITFSWENPGPGGVTVSDGTAIFSLCFTINTVAETVVQPSNTPTAIFAMNGMNQSVGVVPSAGIVNAGVPTTDGLTFIIGAGSGSVGETVCIPVTVFNFEALAGLQFSVDYDPSLVQFDNGAADPCPLSGGPIFDCLPGFLPNNNINSPTPGEIRISWEDQALSDRQVADGSTIFELCFTVLSDECAAISFGTAIAVQFFNANLELMPATLVNGSINCTAAPMIVDADVQSPSCDVDTDGSIDLTVLGGGNLTYSWTPDVGDGPFVENLSPGIYTVIITNPSTGQSTSATYTVEQAPSFAIATTDVTDVRCNGESNGSITIATNGGIAPYIIDWSGNLQDGLLQQNNLTEGCYSVTVTDDNGCSREINDICVDQPDVIIASGSITNIMGPGTGAINLLLQGGTPDYTYQWSGPNNFEADTEDISGLSDPGTYCVTVTDSRGCNRPQCFNVAEENCMITFATTTESGCFGEANGSIDLTVNDSCVTGIFEYVWTNMEGDTISMMEDLEGLEPGMYFVVISQGNSMVSGSVTLNPPTQVEGNGTTTPSTGGDNGAIDLATTGGIPPYTYTWTIGPSGDTIATTRDIDGLSAGTYCVVIEDGGGCAVQECYEVTGEPASVVSSQSFNALCTDSLGSVQVIVANVSFPISATAEPGGFTATSDNDTLTIQLPAGTYDVTIMDSQGQEISVDGLMVDQPAPIVLDEEPTIVSNVDEAACSGSITLNLSGGTGDYDIVWSQMGLSGPQPMQLCDGTYSATVTDDNGCQFFIDDMVIGLLSGEGTTTEVACPGDATGTIDLTVDGGEAPYQFSWSQAGNPDFSADTEDLENVSEGTYTVIITDATGAQLMRTFDVETAMGFAVDAEVTSNFNGFGVSCPNDANGSLAATVSGMGTFSYEWRRNGSPIGDNSPTLTNVPAGEYTLIVTSDANCVVEQVLTVTEPDPIEIVANITDASCEDARDGRIELTVTGGVGNYEYFWDDGRDEPFINFLRPNSYSVEVSDANDCFVTQTFRVEAPEVLSATASSTDATDGCNGSINVSVSGGNGDYTYQWPQLVGQQGPSAEGLCPGEYTIVINDGGGCQSFTISVIVRDRRFPCLSAREVITPNGDGLNEAFILFCTDDAGFGDNTLEIFNRWGQLVFTVDNYDCSQDGGSNCFIGQNNDGVELPEGPYYYVLDYANPSGDRQQLRGSLTILRE